MNSLRFFRPLVIVFTGFVGSSVCLAGTSTTQPPAIRPLYELMVAEVGLARGQYEMALAHYLMAAQASQDPAVAKMATELAINISDVTTTLIPAEIWARLAPQDEEAQIMVAALYLRLGKVDKAIPHLEKTAQLAGESSADLFYALYEGLTDPKDKLNILSALEQLHTTPIGPAIALAHIYVNAGEYGLADKQIQKILQQQPHHEIGLMLQATSLIQQKQPEKGLSILAKANQHQASFRLQKFYFERLMELGKKEEAALQLQKLKTRQDLKGDSLLELARLSMENNALSDAVDFLGKAKQDPEYADIAYYFLGRVLELDNRQEEAIDSYDDVKQGPFHVNSYVRAAWLLTEKKRYQDALHLLEKAEASNAEEAGTLSTAKIEILIEMQAYDTAISLLSEAIRDNPNDINLRMARSYVAEKKGDFVTIEEDLKQVIQLQPDHISALNALGYLLTDQTNRLQEAEGYLQTALALEPENALVLDSMGWLRYKQGRHEEAIQYLKQAMQIQPDTEIAAHLGEVLWVSGKRQEAAAIWQQALSQAPNHTFLVETMEKFQEEGQ